MTSALPRPANIAETRTPHGSSDSAQDEKRASVATADGKRRSARQQGRIDIAVDAPRLLGVAEPQCQADIGRRLEFDACMRAIDWQRAGRGVEGGKRATDTGSIFQGVEPGIDPER